MNHRLAAFSINRTSIACAIFSGVGLEFWQTKSLSTDTQAAYKDIANFIHETIEQCKITCTAIETLNASPTRDPRAALLRCAAVLLQARKIPVTEVSEQTLLGSYGYPPPESRARLRQIAGEMFPQLDDFLYSEELLDAAALGLYVQTELLLESAEPKTSNNALL